MGMNAEPVAQHTKSVPITQAFHDLDSLLNERVTAYTYDLDAGLARLKNTLRTRTTPADDQHPQPGPTAARPQPARACRRRPDSVREWLDTHQAPASKYLTALETTPMRITSVNSPAFAARVAAGLDGDRWLVSWLPEIALTRRQVFSAMVLDEILIAHDLDSATMLHTMRDLAADLHLPLEKILRRLAWFKNPPPPPGWMTKAWACSGGATRSGR
ncbi:hypothetical protein [Nocardia wallacei]|uniref:hypothetical protein n=1 Tax=Nocardia wallacei TaxID=480035 RepID=UPI0024575BC2|nr:hypothetical protein [Nocardia wallacei]